MKKIVWVFNEYQKGEYSPAIIWWYGILEKFGYEVLYYPYEKYNSKSFYTSIKEYNPDFVIHICYDKIHTEFIRIREFSKLYVLQCDDRWRYDDFSKFWIPLVDGVITFEGDKEKYKADGLNMDHFCKMRWAFNPNTMCYKKKEKNILVSHTGGLHGDRTEKLLEFHNKGISVSQIDLNYETAKDTWARSKFSLCFTLNSLRTMKELKGRVVEIPNFSILVTEPFPEMNDYYNDDEIIIFNTIDEAIEKIKYYDKNEDEYNKIFEKGKKALWERNTVYHEWNKILPLIDSDFKQADVNIILKEHHNYV